MLEHLDDHMKYAKTIYLMSVGLIHLIYFITFFGILSVDAKYINYLNVFIQTFVVSFLAIRFHPFRQKYSLTSTDSTIVFGSVILLGTNLFSTELVKWLPTDVRYSLHAPIVAFRV
jgi:hypothetical protein